MDKFVNFDVQNFQPHEHKFYKPVELNCATFINDVIKFSKSNFAKLNECLLHDVPSITVDSGFSSKYQPKHNDQDEETILFCLKEAVEKTQEIKIDIVCYRGSITKISCFPYENLENTKFAVIKLNGCLFIWWYRTKFNEYSEDNKRSEYSGFRFEKIMTTFDKKENGDIDFNKNDLPTDPSFVSCSNCLKSEFYVHNLFYTGEIDCIDDSNRYVEIKCRIQKGAELDFTTKRYCFLKWYMQSFLIGIERLIAGFRDRNFNIRDIQDWQVIDLYRTVRNSRNKREFWNPNLCMSFAGYFFHKLKSAMTDFSENEICIVELTASTKNVSFSKTTKKDNPEYYFLPDWFVEFWKNHKEGS